MTPKNNFFTKELIIILLKAEYLALKYNNFYITPIHIVLAIFLTNNLVTVLLKLKNKSINENKIESLLKPYSENKNVNPVFSYKIVEILSTLYKNEKNNSLFLLLELLKDQEIKNEIINICNFLDIFLPIDFTNILIQHGFSEDVINNLQKIAINILDLKNIYSNEIIYNNNFQNQKLLQILNLKRKKHIILKYNKYISLISLKTIAENIIKKSVPYYLYNTEIWILKINLINYNINKIISNIITVIKQFEYKNNFKLILVIQDQYMNLFNEISDNKFNLLNILLDIMNDYNVHFIFTIENNNIFESYFKNKQILDSYFYIIENDNLSAEDTLLYIKNHIKIYSKLYKIYIEDTIIYDLVNLIKNYIKNAIFPETALIILENACSRQHLSHIKSQIDFDYTHTNTYPEIKEQNILTTEMIKDSISDYLNISKNTLFKDNMENIKNELNNLETNLYKNIFGQNHVFESILPSIRQNLLGLKSPNKPIGSWILCGPSGTGKTELAKILAKQLYGSEKYLIRFDMSEYMEKHSISRLIGCPPGYVGYESGGQLTEKISNNPNSIILFDEIEKAHKDIYNIMLQILDEGRLTDSQGKLVDFTNTIILLTSNLGCPNNYTNYLKNKDTLSDLDLNEIKNTINQSIYNYFKPEFLNRLTDILVFNPLSVDDLLLIFDKFINELKEKLILNNLNISIDMEDRVKHVITQSSYNPLYGARLLKRNIETIIDKSINNLLLTHGKSFFINNKYSIYYYIDDENKLAYKFNLVKN